MGLLEIVWDGICDFIGSCINFIIDVIDGIFNFFDNVVGWFREQFLVPERHTPFIGNEEAIKGMLKTAPKKDVGIFRGVYDNQTDEITELEVVEADSLDAKTIEVLGNDPLVVLS